MKSTVVDESLSSFKPMYCSREYQASTRLSQQYEKSTSNAKIYFIKNLIKYLNTLMDVHVKNNYRYSKAQF